MTEAEGCMAAHTATVCGLFSHRDSTLSVVIGYGGGYGRRGGGMGMGLPLMGGLAGGLLLGDMMGQ